MSLNHRQLHRLHRIESGLLRSDPHLAAMLAVFAGLAAGERLPAWEQVPSRQGRIQQAAALIVKAVTILAAALSVLLDAGRALVAAVLTGGRARPAPSARRPAGPGPGAGDPQGWNPAQGS
jgi:Protein of unknown function (DUF3040)